MFIVMTTYQSVLMMTIYQTVLVVLVVVVTIYQISVSGDCGDNLLR